MSATNLSDLLPVPDGVSDPHAYQVFGLAGGEQDAVKIKEAVAAVYAKLKTTKKTADPTVWKQAAKLAERSKAILADPHQRAELDARFGILEIPAPESGSPTMGLPPMSAPVSPALPAPSGMPPFGAPPAPASSAATPPDPLAGMLPPVNPMAAPAPVAPAQNQPPTPVQPPANSIVPASVPSAAPASQPVVTDKSPQLKVRKTSRRKKSSLGKVLFIIGLCGLTAATAGLGVFVYLGRDISITKDGQLAKQGSGVAAAAAPTQPSRPRRKKDPVMGSLAGNVDPPRTATGIPVNQFSAPPITPPVVPNDDPMQDASMPPAPDDTSVALNDPMKPAGGMNADAMTPDAMAASEDPTMQPMPAVNPDGALPVSPGTESQPVMLSDADVAENDSEIKKIRQLIRDLNWNLMRDEAEKVTQRNLSKAQKEEAESLFNLADLATYYHGGIQRGLGTLKATQDFEVTDGFRVLVVEVGPTSLTIKYNGRNKRYPSLDEIPFRLAEKIASFAMDFDQPDVIASKAVYQAMSPLSNKDYRTESLELVDRLAPEMPDVDTKAVGKRIQELF